MKFILRAKEVWIQPYEIEAESKEEALEKFLNRHLNDDVKIVDYDFEYSHTLNANVDMVEVATKGDQSEKESGSDS